MTPPDDLQQLTETEFMALSIDEIAARTGLIPPSDPDPDEARAFREKAWRSYELDIRNRDEWGTAREGIELPRGEEPEL